VAVCLAVPVGAAPGLDGRLPARAAWSIAPPAAWVRELSLPSLGALKDTRADSGRLYLLVDHQVTIGAAMVEYHRFAWTPLSTAGVQNASEIQVHFDPSYQRLVIHHVRLLRGGKDVFSFRPADVRVIQRETDLDEQIYSGELTAVVFLRDLRPGDTLDYAYSLEGSNPILGGAFDDELALSFDSPVRVVRHVIHAPEATTLHIAPRHTTESPRVETDGGWRTYTWEARDVEAPDVDDDEPGWFDPDPRVEVGTFGSWGEVADWARGLFEQQMGPSSEVARLADQFRATAGGLPAAAAEATRFVQDEVRYLGIEMGPNSHRPHPPAQVLRQRFGDCKDKSLLLVALLRELGIDAAPALVDTDRRRGLDGVQPSPFAFDHAIVNAIIDGRQVWIDPTESDMGGRLEERDPPEFERALILRAGTRSLTAIPEPDSREPLMEVKEVYTLGRPGAPTRFDVVSTFRRREADDMRRELATTAPHDLARKFLDDFARDDSDIKALSPPDVRDDRARNIVELSESYELPSFWKNGIRKLSGWEVREHLPKSVASARRTPLAVPYPVHVRHQVVVRAASPFRIGRRGSTITTDAFAFSSALSVAQTELRLSFDYRSLADSVPAEKLAAHQQAMERVKDALSFVLASDLTSPDAPEEGWAPSWTLLGAGIVVESLAVVALVVWLLARRRSRRGIS